jgi:tRNA(His) 5'-end guanylyltransferase
MNFDELDKKMRVFETAHDYCVLPELFMVARIDGRSFTRLTKEVHRFDAPFDLTFRDYMVETTKHLMNCGFRVTYGYTQSDEISLLFHLQETSFSRKVRKYNSVLAGEASARFSILLGDVASFDCRMIELPNQSLVIDYFRWRNEDAARNALNAHCYWALRNDGKTPQSATEALHNLSVSDKNELLFQYGINFNHLPAWQKRGTGLFWESYEKQGYNPITSEPVVAQRQRVKVDFDLPMKDDYGVYIETIVRNSEKET